MKNIIIIGSRRRDTTEDFIKTKKCFLGIYEKGDMIVSGGCPKGGDRFAEILAREYDVPIKIFRAEWTTWGRTAGFIRNTDIAKSGNRIIACVAPDRTGGTEDTVKKFKKFHPNTLVNLC